MSENNTTTATTKKPRAKRGCDMCRKKKTRCDCYIQLPCSKCRQAKTDCTFLVDQKKRGPLNRNYVESLEYRIAQMENLLKNQVSQQQQQQQETNQIPSTLEATTIHSPEQQQHDYQQQQQQQQASLENYHQEEAIVIDKPLPLFPSSSSTSTPSPLITNDGALTNEPLLITDQIMFDNDNSPIHDSTILDPINHTIPATTTTLSSISSSSPISPFSSTVSSFSPHKQRRTESDATDKDFDLILEEMNGLTIRDYQRTRYIGYSLGLQCLRPNFFRSNRKHRLPQEPSWFVQKINHEDDEHVIMKTKEILQPQFIYHDPTPDRFNMLTDPCITPELADFLIHVFFTRAHQNMPVVNKIQFLEQYYFHNPCPPDKYLLWTIISTGAKMAQVWTSDMSNFNYSPEQLHVVHQRFCEHAHGILALVHQRSMISTVQTLLLLGMLVREEKQEDEDTSHWVIVGLAIRIALDLGLHLDCSDWHIPNYEIEQRRRIFWAAYMTDRWVSAQQGRPFTIIDGQFDVRYPTPYEIGTTHRTRTNHTPVLILEAEMAREQSLPVYYIFNEVIGLHKVLSKTLTHFYNRFTRVKEVDKAIELYKEIEMEMKQWHRNLPNDIKTESLQCANTDTVILRVNYHCVCLLLHRPFTNMDTPFRDRALEICNKNGEIIISIAEEIDKHYLSTLPWSLTTYSLFQASLVFAYNIYCNDSATRDYAIGYLSRCAAIYKKDPYLQKTFGAQILQTVLSSITPNDSGDEDLPTEEDATSSGQDGNKCCQDTYDTEKKNSFVYKAIREHVKIAVDHQL